MYNFPKYSQISFYLPLFMLYPNPIKMKGSIRIRVRITTSRIRNTRSLYVRTRRSRATLAVPYMYCTCLNPNPTLLKMNGNFGTISSEAFASFCIYWVILPHRLSLSPI
jgi:hypothetical protein